jgi:hypothetical protein
MHRATLRRDGAPAKHPHLERSDWDSCTFAGRRCQSEKVRRGAAGVCGERPKATKEAGAATSAAPAAGEHVSSHVDARCGTVGAAAAAPLGVPRRIRSEVFAGSAGWPTSARSPGHRHPTATPRLPTIYVADRLLARSSGAAASHLLFWLDRAETLAHLCFHQEVVPAVTRRCWPHEERKAHRLASDRTVLRRTPRRMPMELGSTPPASEGAFGSRR